MVPTPICRITTAMTPGDRRPVGVIVHHVASVDPLEVTPARAADGSSPAALTR